MAIKLLLPLSVENNTYTLVPGAPLAEIDHINSGVDTPDISSLFRARTSIRYCDVFYELTDETQYVTALEFRIYVQATFISASAEIDLTFYVNGVESNYQIFITTPGDQKKVYTVYYATPIRLSSYKVKIASIIGPGVTQFLIYETDTIAYYITKRVASERTLQIEGTTRDIQIEGKEMHSEACLDAARRLTVEGDVRWSTINSNLARKVEINNEG